MDKRKAIQIMTKAADLYQKNLEDQKILFLYGTPLRLKNSFRQKKKGYLRLKAMKWRFIGIIVCI